MEELEMKQYRSDPLTEREKRYLRQVKGTRQAFAVDNPTPELKKVRSYDHEIVVVLGRRTRRGFNGCKLSHAKRLAILNATETKARDRAAFFASIGVRV
jgi:hypothetical protein